MNKSNNRTQKIQAPTRILIVDDDPALGDVVDQGLKALGYRSSCCLDPNQALAYLESGDIDVLLTDYRMPEMNGVELALQARKLDAYVPIILMTGYVSTMRDSEMSLSLINMILRKPFGIRNLEAAIKATLRNKSFWH